MCFGLRFEFTSTGVAVLLWKCVSPILFIDNIADDLITPITFATPVKTIVSDVPFVVGDLSIIILNIDWY